MSKVKTVFYCQACGAQSPKWVGKCLQCGQWNTFAEEIINTQKPTAWSSQNKTTNKPILLNDVAEQNAQRMPLPDAELSRVLGGGLVAGSLTLLGGEPGIGKSTILLQLALQLKATVLYVSGEESEQQIKIRANRIGTNNENCYILSETDVDLILQQAQNLKPHLVIIDSVQTLFTSKIESTPGSVSQIRSCAAELMRYAKETHTPVMMIGHITKDGSIAGPKVLEHMVDTVLHFEGDRNHVYRILRAQKNRFGSTSELGIYEMLANGLRQVHNPSEILLTQRQEQYSGISIACTMEGMRPILIEVQALVSSAVYGMPQRSATGFDLRRLGMLLAVLEKRCGFLLGAKDVFLNIAGGIKVEDPAMDLAVICAVLSSNDDMPLPPKVCFAGEVGLSGEIRPVSRIEQRIKEAEKLGFTRFFFSKYQMKISALQKHSQIELVPVAKVDEMFAQLFG